MKYTFILVILCSFLFGTTNFDLDIKNITLNMDKKEVLKELPCIKPKVNINKIDKELIFTEFSCKINKENYTSYFVVTLNRYDKVIFVLRKITFKTTPLWKKVKQDIIEYYGSTNMETLDKNKIRAFQLCWGSCVISGSEEKYFNIYLKNMTPMLSIVAENIHSYNDNPFVEFILRSPQEIKKNYKWEELVKDKKKKDTREKESVIDL